ncbi:MAG: hypothetical protein JSW69_07500 [Deltaproteobacteria bacterium]|nr:MAG: hypothetical protein JSW69_07500 [Deltaproteobacteria bacterium]
MKKLTIFCLVVFFFTFAALQHSEAKRKNYYRTFEVISISENSLILKDNDNNVIEVDKDPEAYKVGYKVRYDSVRKRLRPYRWQDYKIAAISDNRIKLQHKTGDTLFVEGNFRDKYSIGDQVRYDAVDNKLQPHKDSGQWKQYTVVEATSNEITLKSNDGQQIILSLDNNLFPERRGVYIGKYKVGDLVRYNATTNKLKKGVLRTYDWQEYEIKKATEEQIILINNKKEELYLENIYRTQFKTGDKVKYDRLNNLLKKVR